MSALKKIAKILLVVSIIVFGISFFMRNDLPKQTEVVESVGTAPVQIEIEMDPVELNKDGFTATISPLYSYELSGLVISMHNSDVWHDYYHQNDPFNTKDLCVVWGSNALEGKYLKGSYKSGDFTCYWDFNSRQDYFDFNESEVSNNHIVPANDDLAEAIKKVGIGDQVTLKGYLASYETTNDENGQLIGTRGTSTTREDRGNNSCEVIYVTDFSVIKQNSNIYGYMYQYSLYAMIGFTVLTLILIFTTKIE